MSGFRSLAHFATVIGLVVICAATVSTAVQAQETVDSAAGPDPDEPPASNQEIRPVLPRAESAEIEGKIAALGSPEYPKREAATEHLIATGDAALGMLRTAYQKDEDLETHLRIEDIVRTIFLNDRVYMKNGFLGIRQDAKSVTASDDDRISEGHLGVRIAAVLPGTAAEEVGLTAQDVIIALDGEPVKANVANPTLAFGESLRVRGPGTAVKLLILRGAKTAEIEVVLRPRPKEYYGSVDPASKMLLDAEAEFGGWWTGSFLEGGSNP